MMGWLWCCGELQQLAWNSLSMASLGSSLIRGLLVMFLALQGGRQVPSRHTAVPDSMTDAAPAVHQTHWMGTAFQCSSLSCHLLAYLRVLMVSSKFQSAGPMFATITVLVLPPRLSCRRRVSLESLQSTPQATQQEELSCTTFPHSDP